MKFKLCVLLILSCLPQKYLFVTETPDELKDRIGFDEADCRFPPTEIEKQEDCFAIATVNPNMECCFMQGEIESHKQCYAFVNDPDVKEFLENIAYEEQVKSTCPSDLKTDEPEQITSDDNTNSNQLLLVKYVIILIIESFLF